MKQKFTLSMGSRVRRSPFFDATVRSGVRSFSVYNHMYMPTEYSGAEDEFWSLVKDVTLWDVSCERQVQVKGADAAKFSQFMTPRDLSGMQVGQCKYVMMCDENGAVLNDPILLKLAEDCFWFSLADSDMLLWAKALAATTDFDVEVTEPDVSPVQVQGPKSSDVIRALFGEELDDLKYFWFREATLGDDIPVIVSRTGWSSEKGYEIFLRDGKRGTEMWNMIMEAGKPFNIKPGCPNSIRRIEGGMYSIGSDFWIDENPFELGLGRLVDIKQNCIGIEALREVSAKGISRKMAGVILAGDPMEVPNGTAWPLYNGGKRVGEVRSAIYSPRLEKNIGLAMLSVDLQEYGVELTAKASDGDRQATVAEIPFYDPKKSIAVS
jgi:glycine cleavage system aminomethyltransferase T